MRQVCRICLVEKERETEFYKNSTGYEKRCKECHKSKSKLLKRATYSFEKAHLRYLRRKKNNPNLFKERDKRDRLQNPHKYKARYTLRNAIKLGKMERLPCERCGDQKSEGHHHDYSKPLDVHWLCKKHHGEQHRTPLKAAQQEIEKNN